MDAVFFHARVFDNEVRTRGSASCTLGTPVKINGRSEEEGIFARWEWDGEQLAARNDRYGFYPIFYFQRPGEICMSPSIFKLIEEGAPTDLDYRALSVFFRLGNFIGEDTPFEHIRTFPPKTTIVWSKDGFQLSSEGMPPPRVGRYSFDDAVDGYIEYFRKAIEHHLPPSENFAIPLSGGMDSRHILFGLHSAGYRPKFCITSKYFPPMTAADPDIAARVTETLDLKHIIIEPLESEFEAVIWRNNVTNFCASEHHWMKTMTDYLVREVETVYDGLGGDVLSAIEDELRIEKERYEFFSGGKFEELADLLLIKNGLKKLFIPEVFKKLSRDVAVRHLGGELEKYAGYPDPSNTSWFCTRTRRMIALAPYSVLSGVPHVFSPFLDHDLVDFLLSLPRDLKWGTDIHGETIRRAYPEYAHIPFTVRADTDYPEHRANRKVIREFTKFFIRRKPKRALRYRYIIPRLLAYEFTERYASAQSGFITLLTYLYQLEEAASRKIGNLEWDM